MGSSGAEKSPLAPVVTVRTITLLSVFVIVTVALGTTAPCGSFTVPEIEPVTSCARAADSKHDSKHTNTSAAKLFVVFIFSPKKRGQGAEFNESRSTKQHILYGYPDSPHFTR